MVSTGAAVGIAAASVVGAAVVAWHGLTWWGVDVKCEKPKYVVTSTLGQRRTLLGTKTHVAEIRRYSPLLAAQVVIVDSNMREALGNGFRALAGFIFGKNIASSTGTSSQVAMTSPVAASMPLPSEKIAMTSPVAAAMPGTSGKHVVEFFMPSNYTKDTLPQPVNEDVKIVEIPARSMAALMWKGGSPSVQTVADKEAQLRSVLKGAGVRTKADSLCHVWQYHPPFAPAWMRRNEVLLEVEVEEEKEEEQQNKAGEHVKGGAIGALSKQ